MNYQWVKLNQGSYSGFVSVGRCFIQYNIICLLAFRAKKTPHRFKCGYYFCKRTTMQLIMKMRPAFWTNVIFVGGLVFTQSL